MLPAGPAVNQRLPSGPEVMLEGMLFGAEIGNSVMVWAPIWAANPAPRITSRIVRLAMTSS
jgi:hypothetical protein